MTSSPTITQFLEESPTPFAVLDLDILERNIERMAVRAKELGIPLRPHGKTPKCVPIAHKLLERNAQGLCVSTLLEAEIYLAAGIRDLFYSVPLGPSKVDRACALVREGARLSVLIDDPDAAVALSQGGVRAGVDVDVLVDLAVDSYRTGAAAASERMDRLLGTLKNLERVNVIGAMSYAGASYHSGGVAAIRDLAEKHRSDLVTFVARLRAMGFPAERASFGSTPAILHAEDLHGVTELRAGIYAFQDLFQAAIGACGIEDIALGVVTEIIGLQPEEDRLVIDAGALALSKDRSTASTDADAGYGLVTDLDGRVLPGLQVSTVSQEIGLVTSTAGDPLDCGAFAIGQRLRVLPNHADMTAAAYEGYHVIQPSSGLAEFWKRFNGW